MPSPLRIHKLFVEGFRGVNEKTELLLEGKSAIIYGGNGTGKTSILQSIEWGLFGHLPYMKGGEFEREDAIVNQFSTAGKAHVQLELAGEGESHKIQRWRARGESSTGESRLTLSYGEKSLHSEEARRRLIDVIGVTHEDFYSTVYMHQDAIKSLISGNPRERSEVIERFLGSRLLKALSTTLPLTLIQEKKKSIESRIEELESSWSPKTLSEEKKSLEDLKRTLLGRGLTPEELALPSLSERSEGIAKALVEMGATLGVNVKSPGKPGGEPDRLQEHLSSLMYSASKVEEALHRELAKAREELEQTRSLRERYFEALNNLASYDIGRFENVSVKKKRLEDEIAALEAKALDAKKKKNLLEKASMKLNQITEEEAKMKEELKDWNERLGGEKNVQERLSTVKTTLREINESVNRSQLYNQILALGGEYFEKFKPHRCPLCKTPIPSKPAVDSLRAELSTILGGKTSPTLNRQAKTLQQEEETLEKELSHYRGLKDKLDKILREAGKVWGEVTAQTGLNNPGLEQLANEIHRLSQKLDDQESTLIGLKGELLKLESQGSLMKSLFTNFEKLKASIKKIIPHWEEARGLDLLEERTKALQASVALLEEKGRKLKEAKDKILGLTQILSYHLRMERHIRQEGGLPEAQRRMEELTLMLKNLSDLEDALTDIHESILKEQKNCFDKVLEEIQDSIRDYYEKILGHPYYHRLEVELETGPGGEHTYWLKGRGDHDSTYVRTRFSEAQLNATALAIFLAMVKHSSHHLGFTVFDDPTQSMDQDHKDALASLLCQEMEGRQIIIATQDQEFYRFLKKHSKGGMALRFTTEAWTPRGPLLTVQTKLKSLLSLF